MLDGRAGTKRTIAVGVTLSVGIVLLYMRSSHLEEKLDVAHHRLAALERNFESMRGTREWRHEVKPRGDVGETAAPATERGFFPVAGFSTPSALREDDQFNARLPARSNGEVLSVRWARRCSDPLRAKHSPSCAPSHCAVQLLCALLTNCSVLCCPIALCSAVQLLCALLTIAARDGAVPKWCTIRLPISHSALTQPVCASERLRYLELKTNGFMNWGIAP